MDVPKETDQANENAARLSYTIAQNPPWYLSVFLGLQARKYFYISDRDN